MSFLRTWEEQLAHEKALRDESRAAWFKALVSECDTRAEIVERSGIPAEYLIPVAKKIGVELPGQRRAVRERYAACAAEGMSVAEAARALGVKPSTVHHAANRYDLSFRRARRGPKPGAPGGEAAKPRKQQVVAPQDAMIARMRAMAAEENKAMRRRAGGYL